jgi:hypothetical protein
VERENAFFKSSPVDEYHLPQMNSEKVFFDARKQRIGAMVKRQQFLLSDSRLLGHGSNIPHRTIDL